MSLSKFKTNSMFHSHETRTKSDLFITSHNTKLFEQSVAYNGVLVYNKLPSKIKSVKSIIKFKKILSNFLLEKSFYSVEEFMTVFCRNWVKDVSPYCNCQCFLLCTMLISILCGPVCVCNYIRFTCLFAFTVIIILFTVTTLWTCPISFCNDF
jgi:hypothetical protein